MVGPIYLDTAIKFLLAAGVMDLRYGRTLPVHLEELKLSDVGNEAGGLVGRGRSAMSQLIFNLFGPSTRLWSPAESSCSST